MISSSLISEIERALSNYIGGSVRILRQSAVSGGCINHAHKLETTSGNYFLKFNSRSRFPGMFEAEARGLQLLNKTNTIRVPEVIIAGEHQAFSFIVLEFLEQGKQKPDYWENAGRQLAQLHKVSSTHFGLDHDNYIGSIAQSNKNQKDWVTFFMEERILPLGAELVSSYEDKLRQRLQELIPVEKPSMIHGDLWNGNIMCAPDGSACFFDPAVYYGHREMDLAMTRLFSGFPPAFYGAYHEEFPLQSGFEERVDLYNLYPLLVHVKLFGGSYAHQVEDILRRL